MHYELIFNALYAPIVLRNHSYAQPNPNLYHNHLQHILSVFLMCSNVLGYVHNVL